MQKSYSIIIAVKETKTSILFVVALTVLLSVLAWLQYAWLGQISDATRERMQNRLQTDTRRFAEDFNREIRSSYFVFQIDPGDWLNNNWRSFNTQYKFWQTQTAYPKLIKNFYFLRNEEDQLPIRYNSDEEAFAPIEWTAHLRDIKNKIQPNDNLVEPQLIDDYTLVMPNFASGRKTGTTELIPSKEINKKAIFNIKPDLSGYLLIELDENVVNQLLSDLNQKYFPESSTDGAGNFNISILKKNDSSVIYPKTGSSPLITSENSDQSVPLFDLSISNFTMIVNSKIFSGRSDVRFQRKSLNLPQELPPPPPPVPSPTAQMTEKDSVKVLMTDDLKTKNIQPERKGVWLLNVRHSAGSLETFIDHTRRKNLAISFGVLLLLAGSMFFIFISSRRAQVLAQRQMDFVSAVSHEFRTPLAVIYSAGENLTDGVIRSEKQITQYGNLIRREGKKMSAMVEQILEFAGARSGRKKYDLRETNVETIVQKAFEDSQSLINEKNFQIETDIAENLPKINADTNALSSAIQNLIINAVKYGGANQWLKVSAHNGGGEIKISVEDKGIGISSKDIANVFTPFYRAKSVVDAQIHGNGLGLSLVKQTVEAHGGKISVESEIKKGSKFTIKLPVINSTLLN